MKNSARRASLVSRHKPKFRDGRAAFNHEPEKGELQAINRTLAPKGATTTDAVNCAEQISSS